jgi:hypothetical protein
MTRDPRWRAAHGRRWVLWLLLFAGVVLHSSMCPPNTHAGVLGGTVRTCVPADADAPSGATSHGEPPAADSSGDGRPCAPAPRPHHHAPCGVLNHRSSSPQRLPGTPDADAMPRCPLPPASDGTAAGPSRARPLGTRSRAGALRWGACLLASLCAWRT